MSTLTLSEHARRWGRGAAVLAALIAALSVAATAHAAGSHWSRHVDGPLSAGRLHLPAGASPQRLARAAIAHSRHRLVGDARLGGLTFAGELRAPTPPGARRIHALRLRQTLAGRRVLWSQLDVVVAGGSVRSISGTVVPLGVRVVSGRPRIGAATAERIARRAVAGATAAQPAQPVVYAGEPERPRAPRRAFVVEVAAAHAAEGICVVVDAETGTVLKTWHGSAARSGGWRPAAHAAEVRNYLVQVGDANGGPVIGSTGINVYTTGDPYRWGPAPFYRDKETFGSVRPAFLGSEPAGPYSWIAAVTDFFCTQRHYCGRDSGLPGPVGHGDVNRWFFTANFAGCRGSVCNNSYTEEAIDRIFLTAADGSEPFVIAHEAGHIMDLHLRDDYAATVEGREVKEALGEMFAYDYNAKFHWAGVKRTPIDLVLANPQVYSLPAKMSEYSCTATDVHRNGYILGHAYWKWIEEMNQAGLDGRAIAGNVLQYVPWRLAGQRTFGDVRWAFNDIIREQYGTASKVFDAYITGFGFETNILFKHSRAELGCTTQ